MNASLIIKIVVLTTVFAPQLVNAFVWENNDEKRQEWKSLVETTFLGECGSDPSESCLKNSSLMQLTKDVCGRVPPGVSEADHRDIFRELCVNDVTWSVNRATAAINEGKAASQRASSSGSYELNLLKERERQDALIEANNQGYQALLKRQEADAKAVRERDLEIQKEREEKRALIDRTGVNGVLVDIFVALSLVLAWFIVNAEGVLLKLRERKNDST